MGPKIANAVDEKKKDFVKNHAEPYPDSSRSTVFFFSRHELFRALYNKQTFENSAWYTMNWATLGTKYIASLVNKDKLKIKL